MNEEQIAYLEANGYTYKNGAILKDGVFISSIELGGTVFNSEVDEGVYNFRRKEDSNLEGQGFKLDEKSTSTGFAQKEKFKATKNFKEFFTDPDNTVLEDNSYTQSILKDYNKKDLVREKTIPELRGNKYYYSEDPIIKETFELNSEAGEEIVDIEKLKEKRQKLNDFKKKYPGNEDKIDQDYQQLLSEIDNSDDPNWTKDVNKWFAGISNSLQKWVTSDESGRGGLEYDEKTGKVKAKPILTNEYGAPLEDQYKDVKDEYQKLKSEVKHEEQPAYYRKLNKITEEKEKLKEQIDELSFMERWSGKDKVDGLLYAYNTLEEEEGNLQDYLEGSDVYIPTNQDAVDFLTLGFGDVLDKSRFDLKISRKLDRGEELTPEEETILKSKQLAYDSKASGYEQKFSYDIVNGTTESAKFLVGGTGGRLIGRKVGSAITTGLGKKLPSWLVKGTAITGNHLTQGLTHSNTYDLGIDRYVGDIKVVQKDDGTFEYITQKRNYIMMMEESELVLDALDDRILQLKTLGGKEEEIQKLVQQKKDYEEYKNGLKVPPSGWEAGMYGFTETLKENFVEEYGGKIFPSKIVKNIGSKTRLGKALYNNAMLKKLNNFGQGGKDFFNKNFGSVAGGNRIIGSNLEEVWEEIVVQGIPTYGEVGEGQYLAQLSELTEKDFYAKVVGQTLLMSSGMKVLGESRNKLNKVFDNKTNKQKRKELTKIYNELENSHLTQSDFNELFMKTGEGKFSVQEYNNKVMQLRKEGKHDDANEIERNKFFNQAMNSIKYGKEKSFKRALNNSMNNPNLSGESKANIASVYAEVSNLSRDLGNYQTMPNKNDIVKMYSKRRYTNDQIKELQKEVNKYDSKDKLIKRETENKTLLEKNLNELETTSKYFTKEISRQTSFDFQRKLLNQKNLRKDFNNELVKYEQVDANSLQEVESLMFSKHKRKLDKKDIREITEEFRTKKNIIEELTRVQELDKVNEKLNKEKESIPEVETNKKEDIVKDKVETEEVKEAPPTQKDIDTVLGTLADPEFETQVLIKTQKDLIDKDLDLADPDINKEVKEPDFQDPDNIEDEEAEFTFLMTSDGRSYDEGKLNTLANNIKNTAQNYEKEYGEKLNFKSFVDEILKSDPIGQDIQLLKPHFESLGVAWEYAGLGSSNWNKLYNEFYTDLKGNILDVIKAAEIIPVEINDNELEETQKESQKTIDSKGKVDPIGVNPSTGEPINRTFNKGKISTSQTKANYSSIEYKDVTEKTDKGTMHYKEQGDVPIMREEGYINFRHLINPNKNNEGDKLNPAVVKKNDWEKVPVAIRSSNGTVSKYVSFAQWVKDNSGDMKLEDFERTDKFREKVPIVYKDSEGNNVAYVADIDWYNPSTVQDPSLESEDLVNLDNPNATHLEVIKEGKDNTKELRNSILDGDVTEMTIIDNTSYHYEIIKKEGKDGEINPPKKLEEVAPDSQVIFFSENGNLISLNGEIVSKSNVINIEDYVNTYSTIVDGLSQTKYNNEGRTLYLTHVNTRVNGDKVYHIDNIQRKNEENKNQVMSEDLETVRWLSAANNILKFYEKDKNTKDVNKVSHSNHPYNMTLAQAQSIKSQVKDIVGIDISNYGDLNQFTKGLLSYGPKNITELKTIGQDLYIKPASNFKQNTSLTFKNKAVVKIFNSTETGELSVEKLASNYDSFLKKRLSTNVMGYNVGTNENPIYTLAVQQTVLLQPTNIEEKSLDKKIEENIIEPQVKVDSNTIKEQINIEKFNEEEIIKVNNVINESTALAKELGIDLRIDDISDVDEMLTPDLTDISNLQTASNVVPGLTVDQETETINYVISLLSQKGIKPREVKDKFDKHYQDLKNKINQQIGNIESLPDGIIDASSKLQAILATWKETLDQSDVVLSSYSQLLRKSENKARESSFITDDFNTEDEIVINEKNYAKSSSESLPIDKVGTALKRIFARISNGNTGFLAVPTFDSFKTMYDTSMAILSSNLSKESDFPKMLNILKEYKDTYGWMKPLIDELERSNEEVQNQFVYNFYKQAIKAKFTALTYGKKGSVLSQEYDSNSNTASRVVMNKWENNFKRSPITVKDKINTTVLSKLTAEWNEFTQGDVVKKEKQIRKWLKKFGITVSDETWKAIKRGELQTYQNKKWNYTPFNQLFVGKVKKGTANRSSSLFLNLVGYAATNKDKENFDYIENANNHPFKDMTFILKSLAKLEAKYNPIYVSSTRYVGGKMLSEVESMTHFYNQTDKLKYSALTDKDYINQLSQLSFSQNSYLLDLLKNDINFAERFESGVKDVMALKELYKRDPLFSSIDELSGLDYMFVQRAMLQDLKQGNVESKYKNYSFDLRMGYISTPTNSDKGRMMMLKTAVFEFYKNSEQAFKIDNEGNVNFTDELKDLIYDQLVEPEVRRALNHKPTNVKSYDKGARRFNFIPGLNTLRGGNNVSVITALSNNSPYDPISFKEAYFDNISTFIEEMFIKEANDNLKTLQEFDDNNSDKFNNSEYINRREGSVKENRLIAELDYTLNSYIGNINTFQTIAGDPAIYFKSKADPRSQETSEQTKVSIDTGINLGKRMALMIAPGDPIANSTNEKYIQVFLIDSKEFAQNSEDVIQWHYGKKAIKETYEGVSYESHIENLRKADLNNLNREDTQILTQLKRRFSKVANYFEIESTDAQEYTTLKEHIRVLKGQGRLTQDQLTELDVILDKYEKEGEDLKLDKYQRKLILQPIKPVYTGSILDGDQDINRMLYIKSSSFPLIPGLTKGRELDNLRKKLEELERVQKMTVRASYGTANKVGALTDIIDPFNETSLSSLNSNNFLVLDRENFKIQQDVPFKSGKVQEDKVSMGTQIFKLLFGDGVMDMKGFILDDVEMDGTQLHSELFDAFSSMVDIQRENLLESLGLTKLMTKVDSKTSAEAFQKLVLKEGKNRGFSVQDLKLLELEQRTNKSGEYYHFKLPLWFSANSNQFEAMFNAIINNKILKQKIPGNSFVTGSEAGFKVQDNLEGISESNIIHIGDFKGGELKGASNDGTKAQVLVSSKFKIGGILVDLFKDFDGKNGEYITRDEQGILKLNDKIDPALLEQFTFRIPTSSHGLGSTIEVVGFLPPQSGDLIVSPKNFITQMGQDFDVDKLNAYQYNHLVYPDGKIKLLTESNRTNYIKAQKELIDDLQEQIYTEAVFDKDITELLEGLFKIDMRSLSTEEIREELKQAKKNLNRNFDLKLSENKFIKIHNSVYTHPGMQKNINKVLSMDFAESQAEGIDELNEGDNTYFSLLSPNYQRYKMNLGSTGQTAIGIYAKGVTYHSLVQQSPKEIGLTRTVVKDGIRIETKKKIKIGNIQSDGVFGKLKTISKSKANEIEIQLTSKISEVLDEKAQTAVDNETAQVLGRVGLNHRDAIAVDNLLGTLGIHAEVNQIKETEYNVKNPFHKTEYIDGKQIFYEEYSIPYLLHSQPIIKEYFERLGHAESITTPYVENTKIAVRNELIREKLGPNYTIANGNLFRVQDGKYHSEQNNTRFTSENLITNMKSDSDKHFQMEVLALYLDLIDQSKKTKELMSIVDMNNLGKSMWGADLRAEKLRSLGQTENSLGISNTHSLLGEFSNKRTDEKSLAIGKGNETLYFIPTTNQGKLVGTAISLSEHIFTDYFPSKDAYISSVVDDIVTERGINRDNMFAVIDAKEQIFQEIKKYITSARHNGIFITPSSEVRKTLYFDTNDNTSLSSYIGNLFETTNPDYKAGLDAVKNNRLLSLMTYEVGEKGKPSLIKFNNAEVRDASQEHLFNAFRELIIQDKPLPSKSGEPYSTRKLAQDLVAYSYSGGGIVKGAIEFHKFIPYEYLDDLSTANKNGDKVSVTKLLQHWDTMNSDWSSVKRDGKQRLTDFNKQYFQNNPALATQYTPSSRKQLFAWENKEENAFKLLDKDTPEFISVKQKTDSKLRQDIWKVYEHVGNNNYKKIDILGETGMSEYEYGNTDLKSSVTNQTKTVKKGSSLSIKEPTTQAIETLTFDINENDTPDMILDKIIAEDFEGDDILKAIATSLKTFDKQGVTITIMDDPKVSYAGRFIQFKDDTLDTIVINKALLEGKSKKFIAQVFLHEYIHALTSETVNRHLTDKTFKLDDRGYLISNQFDESTPKEVLNLNILLNDFRSQLQDTYKEEYSDFLRTFKNHRDNISKNRKSGDKDYVEVHFESFKENFDLYYASLNIKEFMAIALGNNESFIEKTKEMPYKKSGISILEKFGKLISDLLKKIRNDNKLEGDIATEAIVSSLRVIDALNKKKPLFKKLVNEEELSSVEMQQATVMHITKEDWEAYKDLDWDLYEMFGFVHEERQKQPVSFEDSNSISEFAKKNGLDIITSRFKRRNEKSYKFVYDEADKRGVTIKNQFIPEAKTSIPQNVKESIGVVAYFDKKENSIGLTKNFEDLNSAEQSTTLAHEALHGIVTDEINGLSDDQFKAFNKDLSNFVDTVKDSEYLMEFEAVQRVFKELTVSGYQEIITYAFTDTEFAAALNSAIIEGENVEKKTFWDVLKEMILSLISDDRTMMDDLSRILDEHLNIGYKTSSETEVIGMEEINNLPNCI